VAHTSRQLVVVGCGWFGRKVVVEASNQPAAFGDADRLATGRTSRTANIEKKDVDVDEFGFDADARAGGRSEKQPKNRRGARRMVAADDDRGERERRGWTTTGLSRPKRGGSNDGSDDIAVDVDDG